MLTSKTTGKSYIGKTEKSIDCRITQHIYSCNKGSNFHFHRALRKYGVDDFELTILEDKVKDSTYLSGLEVYYIKKYNTYHSGYNSTLGGDGTSGRKFSDETIEKLRNAGLGTKNSRAKPIGIFNEKDELIYYCNGNFAQTAHKYNLPLRALLYTKSNNTRLYQSTSLRTLSLLKRKGNDKYIGWYAKDLEKKNDM